jgi:tryptophan synthase alpha chain
MSRIKDSFYNLKKKNEQALIPYIMAGYPNDKYCMATIKSIINNGADMLEIGFPFSDPLADGQIIQNASRISIEQKMNVKKLLSMIKNIRNETKIPIIIMTYANIIYQYGYEKFLSDAKSNGADGLIIPDLPIEEASTYKQFAQYYNIETIFLVAPNTPTNRIKKICKICSGFLYLVSTYGTTGTKININNELKNRIKTIKHITNNKIPLGIGFGVSTTKDIMLLDKQYVDAVIIGSALLKIINKTYPKLNQTQIKISEFIHELKSATK